jgi:hypothetical protein
MIKFKEEEVISILKKNKMNMNNMRRSQIRLKLKYIIMKMKNQTESWKRVKNIWQLKDFRQI